MSIYPIISDLEKKRLDSSIMSFFHLISQCLCSIPFSYPAIFVVMTKLAVVIQQASDMVELLTLYLQRSGDHWKWCSSKLWNIFPIIFPNIKGTNQHTVSLVNRQVAPDAKTARTNPGSYLCVHFWLNSKTSL